ncbi:MAG TPA: aminotransferase class III-fold pyridoxal phosphate-dependent enzyme [Hyphomonadaceae bacterium]|nr:aminotransferase class III-fold pyridoxal phosphate-dependent enzyme [Hyphomonadaceae bacterium]HPN04189.1 aminotransferase class III-fold pyridoxal phosphate-dependent enzyme [Hyphomonadaceae bacterium]
MLDRDDLTGGLVERALRRMPGGASHEGRQLNPPALFVQSAKGARKFDSDGRSYVDFACGNGAIMLGHNHPPTVEAVTAAVRNGFHFSAGSEAELLWAEKVCTLMPSIEQVRFTSSGNEACLLAFAIARAATGRHAILKLRDHYHGWAPPAVLQRETIDTFLNTTAHGNGLQVVEASDIAQATTALQSRRFAAVILEPTGASFGRSLLAGPDVVGLAKIAHNAGSLCVFDETITGFRVSPGGAQALFGCSPDLTILGKILGGGLPCGALGGRRDLLEFLDNRRTTEPGTAFISHMGTGNGNPVVAAAGLATLTALADGEAVASADRATGLFIAGLNAGFAELGLPWAAYGQSSGFHIFTNPFGREIDPQKFDATSITGAELGARHPRLINDLRLELLANGVDINGWPGGLLGSAHDAGAIDEALQGFGASLRALLARDETLTGWAALM